MKKKKGYSLGEAVLVMAIVGFIAIIAIPILVRKTQDMANISRLQKSYKGLVDAIGSWMVDDRVSDITASSYISAHPDLFMTNYLKVLNQSSTSTDNLLSNCYSDNASDKFHINFVDPFSCASLPNGSTICLTPYNTEDYIVLRNCGTATYTETRTRQVTRTRETGEMCNNWIDEGEEEGCTLSQTQFESLYKYLTEGEGGEGGEGSEWIERFAELKDGVPEEEEFCNYLTQFDDDFFMTMFSVAADGSEIGKSLLEISAFEELFSVWKDEPDRFNEYGGIVAASPYLYSGGKGDEEKELICGMTQWTRAVLSDEKTAEYIKILSGQYTQYDAIEGAGLEVIDQIRNGEVDYDKLCEEKEQCCKIYEILYHGECPSKKGHYEMAPCIEEYQTTETYEETLVDDEVSSRSRLSTLAQNKVHSQSSEVPIMEVLVDTNGVSGPNQLGSDLFVYYVYSDGFVGVKSQDNSNDKCFMNQYYQCFKSLYNNDWKKPY